MKWTPLPTIPDVNLHKKSASEAASLNERIEQLAAKRQRFDEARAAFLACDEPTPAAPGLSWLNDRDVFAAKGMDLMHEELALRQDLAAFLEGLRQSALSAAAEQARAKYEQTREHVLQQLADLGFDVQRDPWMNNLPERHPNVHLAREDARSARAHASDRNLITNNTAALATLREQIDQRRAAAVA
jgi:hypothetical protein